MLFSPVVLLLRPFLTFGGAKQMYFQENSFMQLLAAFISVLAVSLSLCALFQFLFHYLEGKKGT